MKRLLRRIFFGLVIRPFILIAIGLNVRSRHRLPIAGPAVLVANHNSHLDVLVLLTLFHGQAFDQCRAIAAADYFMKPTLLGWIARELVGIIPLDRRPSHEKGDPLGGASAALERGEILILFPEGSRGEPEQRNAFKGGIANLLRRHPETPMVPVFLHGLGKALPKGELIFVPFFCDVFVGETMKYEGNKKDFMTRLDAAMHTLGDEEKRPNWI